MRSALEIVALYALLIFGTAALFALPSPLFGLAMLALALPLFY